ncbi:hypothetical protein Cgig2_016244 [Carnegiea gigantea]|uniref:Uncharacterized protein n=1 Tax=Carnegiea gigantea TaxID=171969 RepID=A0A9Q1JRE8_9CARY|nr:hypothetical protein Cgig2_016244 [Carnegiea gigantea]
MFVSFYNARATDQESWRKGQGFNTDVMKEAVDNSIPSYSLELGLSQPDSQSLIPHTTFVPDPSTIRVNEDDGGKHDEDGAPLRFLLKNTSQVNRELSIKKLAEKKPKEGYKPFSKKVEQLQDEKTDSSPVGRHKAAKQTKPAVHGEGGKQTPKYTAPNHPRQQQQKLASNAQGCQKQTVEQKKGSPRAYSEQKAADCRKPKLTKEVLAEKDNEKRVGVGDAPRKRQSENIPLVYFFLYVIRLTKLDSELSQDELVISNEPLFDGCSDKEATKVPMATLKP